MCIFVKLRDVKDVPCARTSQAKLSRVRAWGGLLLPFGSFDGAIRRAVGLII